VTRSVFSTLTTFQLSVGSFGLNLVKRLKIALGSEGSDGSHTANSLANSQLGPGVDLASLGSLVKRCRSFVLTGDPLQVTLVPPRICAIGGAPEFSSSTFNATVASARITRPHWFLRILPPSLFWSMTPMIFRSFTTYAKDLDHVSRLVEVWEYRLCPGYVL